MTCEPEHRSALPRDAPPSMVFPARHRSVAGAVAPRDDISLTAIGRIRVDASPLGTFLSSRPRGFSGRIRRQNCPVGHTKQNKGRRNAMAESTERTINKHIRVLPEQWERIERAAQGTALTANQLVMELAIEALDRRQWPSNRGGDSRRQGLAVRRSSHRTRPHRGRTRERSPGNPGIHLNNRA